jgi:hypothetical protein
MIRIVFPSRKKEWPARSNGKVNVYFVLAAPLMPNGLPANRATLQTQREITIANDLIGCIIGRGGQKISEIRYTRFHLFRRPINEYVFLSSPLDKHPERTSKLLISMKALKIVM